MISPISPLSFPTYRAMLSFGSICPTTFARKRATKIIGIIFMDIILPVFAASRSMVGFFLYAKPATRMARTHIVINACNMCFLQFDFMLKYLNFFTIKFGNVK